MKEILINMADKINSTNEAIALAIACVTAYKAGKIEEDVMGIVLGTCADCAYENDGILEYYWAVDECKQAF